VCVYRRVISDASGNITIINGGSFSAAARGTPPTTSALLASLSSPEMALSYRVALCRRRLYQTPGRFSAVEGTGLSWTPIDPCSRPENPLYGWRAPDVAIRERRAAVRSQDESRVGVSYIDSITPVGPECCSARWRARSTTRPRFKVSVGDVRERDAS